MITNIDKSIVTIKNCNTDETADVNITLIRDNFILGYCRTCYSYQGSTIKDKMTIFEWDHYFVDREWIYTAITRCNKIGNVLIYNGGYKTKEFNKQKLECYLTKKIHGYIAQDKETKRTINKDNYITKEWLMNCFRSSCRSCGCDFQFKFGPNGVSSNLTAQTN
jgi:hypothetical protein